MRLDNHQTDPTVLTEIGTRVTQLRLDRNLTQQQLADEAGVSRETVQRLESGRSVALSAFIRVLRSLGLVPGLDTLLPEPLPSPLAELRERQSRRQRASGRRAQHSDAHSEGSSGTWPWGIR